MGILQQLLKEINEGKIKDKKDLSKRKRKLASKYNLKRFPSNSEILEIADESKEKIRKILQIKPTRTISGVAVVAVMSKPHECPGNCVYCPKFEKVPTSYTGKEPATRRAISNKFDPYLQVQNRINQLEKIGHNPEKIELIIMGGTFPSMSEDYQKDFIKKCLLAMNEYPKDMPKKIPSLEKIQKQNEKADKRCIGMTFETRPDFAKEKNVDLMLKLGGTRVELGVQTTFDNIYKKVNRGHRIKDVVEATKILKNKGFKILYHMMLGLPGTNREKDLKSLKEIFKNQKFKPDMLKIYPTIVTKGSKLYDMWKNKKYTPINEEYAKEIIIELKKEIPEWVRIMRIERDIPGTEIEAGIKKTNLRQIIQKEMKKRNLKCSCIRCREVGRILKSGKDVDEKSIKLHKIKYKASEDNEYFIQFKDKNNVLVGFLRLRLSEKAIIRELHVYGEQIQIGKKGTWQHKGYGKKLLREAEKIAKEKNYKKIYVISGIGVREYYRKFDYKRDNCYMSKSL